MPNDTSVCHKHVAPNPPPLFQKGSFQFQTHHIGFILSGFFAIISTVVSAWLISKHLQWYTNKREQRYVVRLLFMVPLYALISFASFYFWNQATPIVLVRDAYEAIVLTAFFYLLLMYLSDDPEEQKRIFLKKGLSKEADRIAIQKGLPMQKWCFPLGFIRWKPSDGLYFLQLMKWAVLQYCVIRPTTTLAAIILDSVGLYCETSWNPRWGHIYIVIIISLSVTVAMYCLIQLYVAVAEELSPHRPLLKLFSVKAVVFLTFWQATLLSVLSMFGVIKGSTYMTAEDINIGIGAVIETFEMMLFAFLHIRAFTYKPYEEIAVKAADGRPPTRTPQWRSLGNAMDFRETFREIWIGCIYMLDKVRGKEPKPDVGARRVAHYEAAFGRSRFPQSTVLQHSRKDDKEANPGGPVLPALEIGIEQVTHVELEGHQQWLGLSKHDRYGLHPQREKSEALEDQINHELEKLGYPKLTVEEYQARTDPLAPNRLPWWRTLYNRISQSGRDADGENESFIPRKSSYKPSRLRTDTRQPEDINRNIDDHPPPSLLHPINVPPPPPPQRSTISLRDYDQHELYGQDRHSVLPLDYFSADVGRPSSKSPPPPRTSFNRGIGAVYHDPYEALGGSVYSHLHPTNTRKQHNTDRPPLKKQKARSPPPRSCSYVPTREGLMFPAPLSPNYDMENEHRARRANAWISDELDDRPPPLPSKDKISRDEESPNASYRRSTHRREAAYAPGSQTSP